MLKLEEVKLFLRVDFPDDDTLISLIISAVDTYIKNAVGWVDYENPLCRLLAMQLVTDLYEQRSYTISQTDKQKYTSNSIIKQLYLEERDTT